MTKLPIATHVDFLWVFGKLSNNYVNESGFKEGCKFLASNNVEAVTIQVVTLSSTYVLQTEPS